MNHIYNNINKTVITPEELKIKYPLDNTGKKFIIESRKIISNIIHGIDHRLFVVCGPCSIHDINSAIDYANRLKEISKKLNNTLYIAMRVYFEKPRTTIGWKGLINDPCIDGTYNIPLGLELSRNLLIQLVNMQIPVATETLDINNHYYLGDLFSWAAIGARTTESQIHREIASGLSMPVGFKNGTDGNISSAINAMYAASQSHSFIGINQSGKVCIHNTSGNSNSHIILRGGITPNFYPQNIINCENEIKKAGLHTALMIDCSHANSNKDYRRQKDVVVSVVDQIKSGNKSIIGIMLESNINSGNQSPNLTKDKMLYGVSITDACIDWDSTKEILIELNNNIKDIIYTRNINKYHTKKLYQNDNFNHKLEIIRKKIDQQDVDLMNILKKRLLLVAEVGKIKKKYGLPIYVEDRENKILSSLKIISEKLGLSYNFIKDIQLRIMQESYVQEYNIGFKPINTDINNIVIIGNYKNIGSLLSTMFILSEYKVHFFKNTNNIDYNKILELNPNLILINVISSSINNIIEHFTLLTNSIIGVISYEQKSLLHYIENKYNGPFLILNPIFISNCDNLVKKEIIYCDGRYANKYKWLLDQMKLWGMLVYKIDSKKYDKIASCIILRYFITLIYSLYLLENNINQEDFCKFFLYSEKLEKSYLEHLLHESSYNLYVDIIKLYKDNIDYIKKFNVFLKKELNSLEKEEKNSLINQFDNLKKLFSINK